MQLRQNFWTAICILLCNFAVLLDNFKFQTTKWEKLLIPDIQDSKTVKFVKNPPKNVIKTKDMSSLCHGGRPGGRAGWGALGRRVGGWPGAPSVLILTSVQGICHPYGTVAFQMDVVKITKLDNQ